MIFFVNRDAETDTIRIKKITIENLDHIARGVV